MRWRGNYMTGETGLLDWLEAAAHPLGALAAMLVMMWVLGGFQ